MRSTFAFVFILMLLAACQPSAESPDQPRADQTSTQSPVERGQYLTRVAGCNDCHTPKNFGPNGPEPDMSRELAGHPSGDKVPPVPANVVGPMGPFGTLANSHLTAWVGPWGVSYAANLTSDKATGLGSWTEEMFVNALRTGKHQGAPAGRQILPPMPWNQYMHMTDEDLKAIFAYLQSLPGINNPIPEPVPFDNIVR